MASRGWIKLNDFNLPLSKKIKYRVSSIATLGRIKANYKCDGGSTVIDVVFDGTMLDKVTSELVTLINLWNEKRS